MLDRVGTAFNLIDSFASGVLGVVCVGRTPYGSLWPVRWLVSLAPRFRPRAAVWSVTRLWDRADGWRECLVRLAPWDPRMDRYEAFAELARTLDFLYDQLSAGPGELDPEDNTFGSIHSTMKYLTEKLLGAIAGAPGSA